MTEGNEDETEIADTPDRCGQGDQRHCRATRKQYSAEEKIRIVLDGLRGEETIAELCRRESIAQSIYYKWLKEFLEAGKRRLTGDDEPDPPIDQAAVCSNLYDDGHT